MNRVKIMEVELFYNKKEKEKMKRNILLAVLLLASGLHMAAKDRDLIGMRNFRQLSNIPYDSLTSNEKRDVIFMAFKSNLPAQHIAARDLLNNKFKGLNWTNLEQMAKDGGLDEVQASLDARLAPKAVSSAAPTKVGAPAAVSLKAPPVILPITSQIPSAPPLLPKPSKSESVKGEPEIVHPVVQPVEGEPAAQPVVQQGLQPMTDVQKRLAVYKQQKLFDLGKKLTGINETFLEIQNIFENDAIKRGSYQAALDELDKVITQREAKLAK